MSKTKRNCINCRRFVPFISECSLCDDFEKIVDPWIHRCGAFKQADKPVITEEDAKDKEADNGKARKA